MAYVKVIKTKAYFSRYQVKYRRRREGKTDYRARLRLVVQDKNKYNTPRYRLVARFTNKDIVAQVVKANITGDEVVASAYAHELPKYGMKAGLTNYASAYCVGLLCARRLLAKFGMADLYKGVEEATGEDYQVEEADDGPRPFLVVMDTGLKRTSTGSKVFAVMKGALDGGLEIPHSDRRYVGYDEEAKELDTETLKKYIMGGHVAEYMEQMQEENPEKYKAHFSQYLKAGLNADNLEETFAKVHAAIRAKPEQAKKARKNPGAKKAWKQPKLTYEQRKEALKAKLIALSA
jgi:large subunit ribosomal protein L5e